MQVRGTLDEQPISRLSWVLSRAKWTGSVLLCRIGEGQYRHAVRFRDGKVYGIRSTPPGPLLSDLLFQQGFVSATVLGAARRQFHSEAQLIVALLERGLPKTVLEVASAERVRTGLERLYDLPADTEFLMSPGVDLVADPVAPLSGLDARGCLPAGVRRMDPTQAMRPLAQLSDEPLRLRGELALDVVEFSNAEREVLSEVMGEPTIGELLESDRLDPRAVRTVLHVLVVTDGLVPSRAPQVPVETGPRPIASRSTGPGAVRRSRVG
jgi:hypothetical protein